MKREKQLTKRDRKALKGPGPAGTGGAAGTGEHIHCVACGRHIDPSELTAGGTATRVICQHRSAFASCVSCVHKTREILAEHDRTGQPVKAAGAWH